MSAIIDTILEVRGLNRYFGALRAVDDVSFKAERGHITSVIGPNGAGKSTLFNLITGAITPNGGNILFNSLDVTRLPVRGKLKLGMARSFQITNLFFDLSVLENLRLATQFLELPHLAFFPIGRSKRAIEKALELLERFELTEQAALRAGELSHGERRRLEIAVTLASEPELLLLDEPTQGMSHSDTEETAEIIKTLSKEISILLIEHDISLVMDLSDHVLVMHQGANLAEGTPETVRNNPAVKEAYLGHA
jgi:branched-chain amino acid transport system ATP-binding protein